MNINLEKLQTFLQLIDKALEIAEKRQKQVLTPEFRQYRIASIVTLHNQLYPENIYQEGDINDSMVNISFSVKALIYFIDSLKEIREGIQSGKFDKFLIREKGKRPGLALIRYATEIENVLGDDFYNESLFDALYEVERYFDEELD